MVDTSCLLFQSVQMAHLFLMEAIEMIKGESSYLKRECLIAHNPNLFFKLVFVSCLESFKIFLKTS
jgi:hypothetical protein